MSQYNPFHHFSLNLNPDGTLTRNFNTPTKEPNPEPSPGVTTVSKDITIDHEKQIWVRIFRPTKIPSNDNTVAKLPILLFFHYGGFVILSPADTFTHNRCSQFAADIPAIVVSVAYRLAPENRLPAQYHDGRDAILWVKKQVSDDCGGDEEWLKDYGDPSRVYLYGVGSGANIVFHTAMLVADMDLEPFRIRGVVMNQPMFGGMKRTRSELKFAVEEILPLPVWDMFWELALPEGTNRDHWYCNPLVRGPHLEKVKKLGRCLVIGYYGDSIVDRQQEFVTMLVKCGVQVEAHFDGVGFHNVEVLDPVRSSATLNIIKEFML